MHTPLCERCQTFDVQINTGLFMFSCEQVPNLCIINGIIIFIVFCELSKKRPGKCEVLQRHEIQ